MDTQARQRFGPVVRTNQRGAGNEVGSGNEGEALRLEGRAEDLGPHHASMYSRQGRHCRSPTSNRIIDSTSRLAACRLVISGTP